MSEDRHQQSSGDQSPNINTESGSVSITYNNSKAALLKVIPDYIDQLLDLVRGPRRFFAALNLDNKKTLVQGIVFLSISSFAGFVLRIPVAGDDSGYWQQALITTISYITTGLILSVLAFVCCRLVGGRGVLRGHVSIFSYMAGVSVLLFALVALLAQGIILIKLKEQFPLYQEYMSLFFTSQESIRDPRFATLEQGWALNASMAVLLGGTLVILGWMAVAWRALGDFNRLSAGRVSLSLFLFLVIGSGVNEFLSQWQAARGISIF